MDLNDFVVPNNKTRSVKLNARNLQKLQLDTTALASESKEMEEKLEQLKENMSKEKEERGHLRDFRWRFGQCMSSDSNSQPNGFKRTNDNKIQKLSAGKLKIRVLKDESLSAPPQSSPSVPSSGLGMTRRSRVKGTISRQEIKTAKLTDAQAHVICQDVSCFQRQINPGSSPNAYNPESTASPDSNHSITSPTIPGREDESSKKGTKVKEKQMKSPDICSQVPVVKHEQEKAVGVTADDRRELANLFTGRYSEEESARSFQEALMEWRKERSEGIGKLVLNDVLWTPVRPASVSAMSTQTDLSPDREAEGQKREGAEGKLTVKLEFSENSLTYMERLVLKKHRRTPVDSPSLAFGMDFKSLPTTDTEEEMAISLTAEEEDFHQYCSSLFSVPVSQDRTEPQLSTPELCLVIEVLDEVCIDMKKVSLVEKKLDNNRIVSAVQQISGMEQSEMSQTPLFVHRALEAEHSSPHPPQNSKIDNSLKGDEKPDCWVWIRAVL
ncbi:zinc finger B-box domain-containing protein 1 [Fundulus heteroclitus]|uniref:zinc finger B-box domain-containing protein 1 n=1 Tax=Fundulus heteroclitus TaxID=8078 RepID=UPI00165A4314|nr:zinc finger B-box domain-containing protein 1 [Fundulus heteroclitus]